MPVKTYQHPFGYGDESPVILDFKTYAVRRRLPMWRVCADPKPPFILFGETNWNCTKCEGQPPFKLPVLTSDSLQFQFQFDDSVNTDPMEPEFGWLESTTPDGEWYMSARILDCECNGVADMVFVDQFASDWGVAWDADGGSFQWINFDLSLFPTELCCFYLQVEQFVFNPDIGLPVVDQIITAGPYYRADIGACGLCEDNTVLISGTWKKKDCWGRRYDIEFGAGQTTFTDSVRLLGEVIYLGSESEDIYDGEVLVKSRQREKYRVELGGVPPLIAQWLGTLFASNDTLTIGDYQIDRSKGDTVGAVNKSLNDVQMFHTSVEFSIVCEIVNFGCN